MSNKIIQEQFGQAVIDSFLDFAKSKIPDPDQLDAKWFDHIQEKNIREALVDTYYGSRWMYRIGLGLLVKDRERLAHIRAQVIDYASICETLLSEMIVHGIEKSHLTKTQWEYADFNKSKNKKINWKNIKKTRDRVSKLSFAWYIKVCEEENIIDATLAKSLESQRVLRNTVHLTERARANNTYSLRASDDALKAMQATINQTKKWRSKNK
ncbi:hypothetical protein [Pseudomonas putida]|uniref:hypothetical protein n=1 Tax=Pseudomonas putida TaxID=303 RepID=UPI003D07BED6